MTNRDYANRQPKRRATPKKRTSKRHSPTPKRLPVILTLFVCASVIGFGYFLWGLKSGATDSTSQVNAPETADAKPVTKVSPKPQHALPPKPKEEWTYLESLKNKKVEVDLPAESKKPKRPYKMQCGSFRKAGQANEMKAVIAFQGLEAQVRKTNGTKGTWYKVVLGPFDNKRAAERQRHVLQKAGLNGCQIWFWEG